MKILFVLKFDNFLRNEEVRRVQKKIRFICGTELCLCVVMVWSVRRPATGLSSGQFVRVASLKNFQNFCWLFLGEIEMFETNLVRKANESCFISTDMWMSKLKSHWKRHSESCEVNCDLQDSIYPIEGWRWSYDLYFLRKTLTTWGYF